LAFETLVAAQTDIFCIFGFFLASISSVEQPANRGYKDKDQDHGMKLEEQEKKKRPSEQKKDGDQDYPERIILCVLTFSR
jgi:hypothetical protein